MEISSLKNLSILELTTLFNRAFADYFVKINLTPEILQEKIYSENVKLNKSVGIFSGNKPVGFILHAVRTVDEQKIAYNAGTGVIPEFRGEKSTIKMYKHILPILKKSGLEKIVLEVMEQNIPAIKSYLHSGFKKTKNLECFNGVIQSSSINKNILFKKIENKEVIVFREFWDWKPTWQHSIETITHSNDYQTFGAFLGTVLVGYVTFIQKTGRVAQFAVNPKYRRNGVGSSMFKHLSEICPKGVSLINIDGNDKKTIQFLKKIGLSHFLRQFEMELDLNNINNQQ